MGCFFVNDRSLLPAHSPRSLLFFLMLVVVENLEGSQGRGARDPQRSP
jgi:hypothetical protein